MEGLPMLLLTLTLWGYVIGALAGLLCWQREKLANLLSFGSATLAALGGLGASVVCLVGDATSFSIRWDFLESAVPYLKFSVRLDPLSAFFLLIVSSLGLALSIYSFGYARGFYGRTKVGVLGAFYNALLLATTFVFIADNAFFFLVSWELMAMTAYFLVTFEHEQPEARHAGVLYFIMSHIGTGCIILGFLLLFQASGGYGFIGFHALGERMSAGRRDAAFLLFLAGFGVKAGIVPLHIWLPAAHPVAPSNVSALLSGVIIKSGIYGLTRVYFDFLGTPPLWWGVTLLVVGSVSALLGVLYALMDHDLKRLLAYHSIENIGIILMGLGAALMFQHANHPLLGAMALIAGLYHTINHALFKGLLFLGAGAVQHAAHTRNMEELGGLIKRMPRTAFFFLIGAVAISALPPLNGFVSEWLTYQSLLQGFGATGSLTRLIFPISGALLALTGALAAACFVKAFGITFLAQPRSVQAERAHEASPTMLAGMALLAVACVFLGLFPNLFLPLFDPLTDQLLGAQISRQLAAPGGIVLSSLGLEAGTVSTLGITLTAVCLLPIPLALWIFFGRAAARQTGMTWACGQKTLTPQMQYTATGFSKPLRIIFKALFRPHRAVQAEFEFSPYFARTIRFESHIEETFEARIYRPLQRFILRTSRRMRALQAGSLQAYLIYIFVTLLLLLILTL